MSTAEARAAADTRGIRGTFDWTLLACAILSGDRHTAYLAPMPEYPAPSADFVRRCLDVLADRGFHRVLTGART